MSAYGTKLRRAEGGVVMFHCPGCNESHAVSVGSGVPGRNWAFNANPDAPTFHPSVLVRTGHHVPGQASGASCWCTYNAENPGDPAPFECRVCHSWVRDGRIEFLSDCTHALAGQTVDLPDWNDAE